MAKIRQRKTWTHDRFTDDAGVEWNVHKRTLCKGSHCALHNPSVHPLNKARIVLRHGSPFSFKPHGFAERICEHGIGHSDPDSVAFYDSIGEEGHDVHGCDGCCFEGGYEKLNGVTMTTIAPPPDPFEEYQRINEMLDEVFVTEDGSEYPFGYTDPDVIEREVAKFRAWLESTPTAERK